MNVYTVFIIRKRGRYKKKGSTAALQGDENHVNIYNLVHPGKTGVANYFFLGGDHFGYDDRRV